MVDICMTHKCNNNCIMCTEIMPSQLQEPSKEVIIKQINNLKNPACITLTGGEPTLRKDLFEIIKFANLRFPNTQINLITNGILFSYKAYAKQFNPIKNLLVITEIHGPKLLHNKITRSSSYEKTLCGITNMLRLGLDVEIRIIIHKLNYNIIPEIARLIKKDFSGVKRVVLMPIDIIGNAYKNKKEVFISNREITPYIEKVINLLKGFDVKVFHLPFCLFSEDYHGYIKGMTVSDYRVSFAPFCQTCLKFDKCPGLWKTYARWKGFGKLRVIK